SGKVVISRAVDRIKTEEDNNMKKVRSKKVSSRSAKRNILFANVILRSATGKSVMAASSAINPRTVAEYLPSEGTREEARRLLVEQGFQINLVASTHITIAGRRDLFERTFRVSLKQKFAPYLERSKERSLAPATQAYYVAV